MTQRRFPPQAKNPESPNPESPLKSSETTAERAPARRTPRVIDARHLTLGSPNRRRPRSVRPLVVLLLVTLLPLPALAADWLVLRDGGRLQVAGSWHVEGDHVRFHLPNGTLASLPASAVDLLESSAAKMASRAPELRSQAPALPEAAAWVLTDADVRHARPAASSEELERQSPEIDHRGPRTTPGHGSARTADALPRSADRRADSSPSGTRAHRFVSSPLPLQQALVLMKKLEATAERVCVTDEGQSATVSCSDGPATAVRELPASSGASL